MVTVVDRGFSSDENLRYLTRAGGHWIAGERMRDGSPDAQAARSRARAATNRYADNPKVKEVRDGEVMTANALKDWCRFSRAASAQGDYPLACAQLSKVLGTVHLHSLRAARRLCVRQLRSAAKHLDMGQFRSLASTRLIKVRVYHSHGRARVTVQRTLYGVMPRATGIAIREDGRWKIAEPLAGAHWTSPFRWTL